MKLNKLFAAFMLIGAVAFASCGTNLPDDPDGPGPKPQDSTEVPTDSTAAFDWTAANLPDGAVTVAEARAIAAALASDGSETTSQTYYVYGIVKKFGTKHESGVNDYGNATFYMVDKTGDSDDFEAYQVYNLNKEKFTSLDQIAVGDHVVVCCHITNYNGTYETAGKGDGYVWWNDNPKASEGGTTPDPGTDPSDVSNDGSEAKPYTATEVIALNNTKTGNYYVKAYIVGQVKGGATSATNNCEFAAPFTANDNGTKTNILLAASATGATEDIVVPVQLPAGDLRNALNLITNGTLLGQEIVIYGSLEKYFGKAGVKTPTYAVVNGTEIGTKPGATPEPSGDAILSETLLAQESFDKFTAVSVSGDQVWTFDSRYGAKMSGYANSVTNPNEDWFVTPALDLAGKTNVTISFEHAFGPAASVPSTDETKAQYTIWVSNDFDGTNIATATWTKLEGMAYGTAAWSYVSSGEIAIPAANLAANCRIAWKYVCESVSATWEIKNVVVK